ncbi:MAG: type 1 glutamine amidotransferase [Nitrososphaeraceae archaeon]
MTKPILCLQNIPCETLGNFEALFLNDGFEIEKVNATTQRVPIDPTPYSAIVILGGPMSVYENSGFITDQIKLARISSKEKTPLLGICLGSQIVAQSSGGTVFKGPKKEIGWHEIMIESSGKEDLFSGFQNSRPMVFHWHGDTFSLPKTARILARSKLYPEAFAIGSLIGIQFHLEVTDKMIRSWLRTYKSEVISEKIDVRKMVKESAAYLKDLEQYCGLLYSNFCAKFSL